MIKICWRLFRSLNVYESRCFTSGAVRIPLTDKMQHKNGGDLNDVATQLSEAWKAVQAAGIPEHLQEVAFKEAFMLSAPHNGRGSGGVQHSPRSPQPVDAGDPGVITSDGGSKGAAASAKTSGLQVGADSNDAGEEDIFARFATESGVDEESLRRVYVVRDDALRISLSKSKLGTSEAERNRSVGLLLAASRYYVYGTIATPISEIREAATKIPYEVSRNFGSHMDRVDGTLTGGSGRDKTVRVQTGKIDEPFRAVIRRVLGETDE
jgi:hypothetical protein